MQITMLQTTPGSIDGIRVTTYDAGTEYNLTATDGERSLAAAFVGAGFAVEVGATVAPVVEPAPSDAETVIEPDAAPAKAPKRK